MKKEIKRFDFKKPPKNPNLFWRYLAKLVSLCGLSVKRYKLEKHNMKGLKPPYIMLANHASMVDFMVAQVAVHPARLNNVASIEAFHD